MDQVYGHLNRPVHLARRDTFLERAMELLFLPLQSQPPHVQIRVMDSVQTLLHNARQHAEFATRSDQHSPKEQDLIRFLDLMIESVEATTTMLQHRLHLEQDEGFLRQFLQSGIEQAMLPAVHYQRRAEDILQGLRHLLRLGQSPYQSLKQQNIGDLDGEDHRRYQVAYQSFLTDAQQRFPAPQPAPTVAKKPVG